MSVELRLLKDAVTGLPFVPVTHWNAVSNKPNIDGSLNSINASLNALDASTLDIYNNLSNAEEVIATVISKLNYTIGFDSSANLVWSEESGLTADTIKAAIELVNRKSGVTINDSSVNVAETWSSLKISDELNNIDIETIQINDSSIDSSTVWSSLKVNNEILAIKETPYLKFTANTAGSTIALSNNNGNAPDIKYSRDGINWTQWDYSVITLTNAGDYIYMKGDNSQGFASSYSKYSRFVMTGSTACSGNIMSLIDNGKCQTLTILCNYCFYKLFYNCSSLTSAPELPATTLANSCYYYMFYGCSSLTSAPELPATTLVDYCYYYMFLNCTSLTSAPELPVTTLARNCYNSMFRSCTSLTSAPELPATTLAGGCYCGMFDGCSSLTSAPELPATTLASECYNSMFDGCSSLTSAPELPATTLAEGCYIHMFLNCTSLTSAPELPATALVYNCYYGMFNNCSKLSYIKCLATTGINRSYSTTNWVSGVASAGTFVKHPNSSWPISNSGIPFGWNYINLSDKQIYENGHIYDPTVNSIAEGVLNGTVDGIVVRQCVASGVNSHAEGNGTIASGVNSHAEGYYVEASGNYSHAEGYCTEASGDYSHAEGYYTESSGMYSHAEGYGNNTIEAGNLALLLLSYIEYTPLKGYAYNCKKINGDTSRNLTSGQFVNINGSKYRITDVGVNDGIDNSENIIWINRRAPENSDVYIARQITEAAGDYSHAEGCRTYASGSASHTEGCAVEASGWYSHAEGCQTEASGDYSHAEGVGTRSLNKATHAEGSHTESSGMYSHAEGYKTQTINNAEHAQGKYNLSHINTIHSIGIGSKSTRMNAVEVLNNGDVYITGIGHYEGTDTNEQDSDIKPILEAVVQSDTVLKLWSGTQAQYDAIATKDNATLYLIKD